MPFTPEYTEIVAGTPELLFGAVKDHHEWIPKLAPHVFTNVERREGEGIDGLDIHFDIHEDKRTCLVFISLQSSLLAHTINLQSRSCLS